MIRALRAMGWLRWRLLLNTIRGSKRRDAMERVSRVLALMVPIILAALFVGSTVFMTIAGFLGGLAIAEGTIHPATVILIVRGAIAVLCAVVIIIAAGSPGYTTLSRYTRLLVMPIPRQALHLVEVVANLSDPWQVLLGAGLFAFSAGLLIGGAALAAFVALVAGALVMGILASLSAAMSFLVAWLFRSRRRGELFTLIFVMALSGLSLIPAFLSKQFDDTPRQGRPEHVNRPFNVDEFNARIPSWTRVLPSEAYGLAIQHAVTGRTAGISAGLLLLVGQVGLLFLASSAVHRRVIQSLEGDVRRKKGGDVTASPAPQLPFVGAAASAVAWAQYRTALRSVRGRLIVLFPGPLLALMMVIFRNLPGEEGQWAATAEGHGYLVLAGGVIFGLYSLQAFTMNMFGSDRSGLTLQLLAPISDRHLAWGKVYGCWLILCAAMLITLTASIAVAPSGSPLHWLGVIVAAFAIYMSLSPITVWLSALFPQPSDLSKTGSGGNPHPLPMFVGTFLVLIAALPTFIIFLIEEVWWKRPILALAGVSLWALIVAAIAIPLVNVSAKAVRARRENLALVAQGK